MPKGGSRFRTSRPAAMKNYYANKEYYDKRDAARRKDADSKNSKSK